MNIKISNAAGMLCLLLALPLAIGLAGCKREGCTDPLSLNYDPDAKKDDGSCTYAPPTFALHVHHYVDGQAYSTGTTYTHASGRQYRFTIARFYLSGLELETPSGHEHLDGYAHIVAPESEYGFGQATAGSYTGLGFHIGVDSAANHSDPTTYAVGHALAATSQTLDHWSWNSGYVFVRIEGLADTTAAMTGTVDAPFALHIGGDNLLQDFALSHDIEVPVTGDFELSLAINWAKALDGVDMRDANTHTMDNMPLAQQVIANLLTAITVE